MDVRKVESKINNYLNSNSVFKFCEFDVNTTKFYGGTKTSNKFYVVDITLLEANFEAYLRNEIKGKCAVRVGKRMEVAYRVGQLDPSEVISGSYGKTLSEDAKEVFRNLVIYIKSNFAGFDDILYGFHIKSDYRCIAKPTEIEHKTFKGRKRRSVVEGILGRF